MSYVAPFRAAVLWLLEQPYRWNAESLATLTGQSRDRAKAYLTQLVVDEVLKVDLEGCYAHAWCYMVWRELSPASRPGGHSRAYVAASQERAEDYFAQHQARMNLGKQLRELRGELPQSLVAERSGITRQSLYRLENGLRRARIDTVSRILAAIEELSHGRRHAN